MKFKDCPEDFRVRELAAWDEVPGGDYRVYRVRKRKLTTFEAIDRIRNHTGATGQSLSYAGLKDRQSISTQHLAIKERDIRGRIPGLRIDLIGRTDAPLSSRNLRGNHFEIVVRDLEPEEAERYCGRAREVIDCGLPNHFDEQRFGAIRAGQGFIARELIQGSYERALQALLAMPGPYDSQAQLARKVTIRRHWGQWPLIAKQVRGSPLQVMLEDLARNPGHFVPVLNRMPARTRAVHLLAYQA